MDKQSAQPMLGVPSNHGQALQIEVGDVGRVPSTHSFFKKTRSNGLLIGLIIAILLCISLLIALCVSLLSGVKYCTSPQCIKAASSLLESMNTSVNPCDNFYQFTCGSLDHEFLRGKQQNSWFSERNDMIESLIADLIKSEDTVYEDESLIKARTFYQACMDTEKQDENGLDDLIHILRKLNLPKTPPISSAKSWDWVKNAAKARRWLNLQILIGGTVDTLPTNRSITKMDLDLPDKLASLSAKSKKRKTLLATEVTEDDVKNHENWKTEVTKFLTYFCVTHDVNCDKDDIEEAATDILSIERALLQIDEEDDVEKEKKPYTLPHEMTIHELQTALNYQNEKQTSKIDWVKYFETVFEKTGVQDVRKGLERNETILVHNLAYYKHLYDVISGYSSRQLGLFVWWRVVYYLSPHVNAELFELRKDVDAANDYEIQDREEMCVSTVVENMKEPFFILAYDLPNLEENIIKVHEMINNMKDAFKELLSGLSWMDETTKLKAYEKVEAMVQVVAFPDWLTERDNIDEMYKDINISLDNHLNNLLTLYEVMANGSLSGLREIDDSVGSGLDPLEVNAFYKPQENLIFIPAAILQFPFYNLGLEALNYGALGVILGHEVTHGFDDTGRLYDELGNYHTWWSQNADKEYNNRAQCFINKFGNFHIELINKTVDGNLTLDENLADNGGLIEGLMAYRKYVDSFGMEDKLPGLEQYTHDQLFFLSFAHTWCEVHTYTNTIEADLTDEHAPSFVRILVGLQDSDEFAEVWNCPKGSDMNPKQEKCTLWLDD